MRSETVPPSRNIRQRPHASLRSTENIKNRVANCSSVTKSQGMKVERRTQRTTHTYESPPTSDVYIHVSRFSSLLEHSVIVSPQRRIGLRIVANICLSSPAGTHRCKHLNRPSKQAKQKHRHHPPPVLSGGMIKAHLEPMELFKNRFYLPILCR